MAPRARLIAFGSAAVLVIAGALCAALVPGLAGQLLTIVLMSLGLGGAVLLVFLEVGLSEDREREQEQRRREAAQQAKRAKHAEPDRLKRSRWRRRPG